MSDGREPIIDPMLEELLGGQSPPDLKQHILRAYAAGESSGADEQQADQEAQSNRDSFPKVVARPRRPRQPSVNWLTWASVAIVLMGAGIFFASRFEENTPPMVADQGPAPATPDGQSGELTRTPAPARQGTPEDPPPSDPTPVPELVRESGEIRTIPDIDPDFYEQPQSPHFKRERDLAPGWPNEQIVAFTNDQLKAQWREVSVWVQRISDEDWYLRTSRFLTGVDPPSRAVNSFLRDPNREVAVTSFLSKRDFSSTWSKRLADMLVGQFAPDEKSFSRDQLEEYLNKSLVDNKPYDQLTFELITAVGSNDSAGSDFNRATNFLLAFQGIAQGTESGPHLERKKIEATNIVCQLFLGKQLQCAQCHDHPSAKWSQDDYWQMVSFFVQMQRQNLGNGKFRLVNGDFTGDQGTPEHAELTYQRAGEETTSVFPTFIDGEPAKSRSGIAALFDRRVSLAKMIVNSDDFAKTIVNRLWDQAFGSGFTYPVDDLDEQNRPSHPELLERLAAEFENSGYDLRAVLRWITLCSAFELEAGPGTGPGLFNTYAKDISTPTYAKVGETIGRYANSGRELAQMIFANIAETVSESEKAEATRRFYEKMRDELLSTDEGSRLHRIANSRNLTEVDKIDHLFLSILGRLPTRFERNQSRRVLKSGRQQVNGLRDIGYILISSKEFAVQH